jgi:Fe2+ transport system protein FeoA
MILILNSTPTLPSPAAMVESPPTTRDTSTLASDLSHLQDGAFGRIVTVEADADDAIRLKSLGLCIGRRVQLAKGGDPLIVRVLGARVGLSRRLAACVLVESL